MTEEERLAICETCANRMLSVCTLTGKVPEFEKECPDYEKKVIIDKQEIEKKEEKECVEIGRKTTLALLWIFVVLFIATALSSYLIFDTLASRSTALILIVLGIEIGLFYAVYHGINWARILLSYLIIISPFFGVFSHYGSSKNPLLLLLLFFLYLFVMFFLFRDKCFKKFFDSRRKKA
jgi:4-hydroxybenzoate polyprenyltransferase